MSEDEDPVLSKGSVTGATVTEVLTKAQAAIERGFGPIVRYREEYEDGTFGPWIYLDQGEQR